MTPLPPVIVTRPEAGGRRLTDELIARGFDALWLPAFEIGPAPDEAAARTALAQLAAYDLAIFVSPAAARATAALLAGQWPAHTAIGAVGATTGRAAAQAIAGAAAAPLIAPSGADELESGSEAFWKALRRASLLPRRVLLLRAQDGRQWLAQRLAAAGAQVDAVAVYARRARAASDADLATLQRWRAAGRVPAALVTSSEAIDLLFAQVARLGDGAADWLRSGVLLATHARIATGLRAAGCARVMLAAARADAIAAALKAQVQSR